MISGKYGMANYGPAVDVYSATVVVWQLLSLKKLYPKMSRFDIEDFVKDGNRPDIPSGWSANVAQIIAAGWLQNPTQRCTAAELHMRLHRLLPNRRRSPSHSLRAPGRTFSVQRSRSVPRNIHRRASTPAGEKAKRKLAMVSNSSTLKTQSLGSIERERARGVPPVLRMSKSDPIDSTVALRQVELPPHAPPSVRASAPPKGGDVDNLMQVKVVRLHDGSKSSSKRDVDDVGSSVHHAGGETESEKVAPEGKAGEKKTPSPIHAGGFKNEEDEKVVLDGMSTEKETSASIGSEDALEKATKSNGPFDEDGGIFLDNVVEDDDL